MFNNIIYFIIVLLIFGLNYPDKSQANSLLFFLTMLLLTWLIFAGFCCWGFRDIQKRLNQDAIDDGGLTAQYQRLIVRLSIMAIFLFALAVYFLNLKYWLQLIPGVERFSVLQGLLALSMFIFYLSTVWYFAYPVYKAVFRVEITRQSYITSNLRFNIPILFPWFFLSLVYDLVAIIRWPGKDWLLDNIGGQLVFFAGFIFILMIFMPAVIQYWWGCKPINTSEKGRQLEAFLKEKNFKYRHLLNWPIFEGKMMTAGIMGILPRYRYLLITDSLLEALSMEELKAVLAHEMGHARYRHLLLYIVLFVGFMVISFGLFELFYYLFMAHPGFMEMLSGEDSHTVNFFNLILSLPMLVTIVVYFRFIVGFFMRNFERQADLYSATTMGTPEPAISALEKIAYLSGKSRDLPSWHHFSIRERAECLLRSLADRGLTKRHNRFVATSFIVYLILLGGLGYFVNFSPVKQNMAYTLVGKALKQQLLKEPNNINLYLSLAEVSQYLEDYEQAIHAYKKIISLKTNHATSLNNLAWILVTAPDQDLRDLNRGLDLAKKAVALERSPVFLDTLAEAYYRNGLNREAVKIIKEAIALATENREYYEKQLKKFLSSRNL